MVKIIIAKLVLILAVIAGFFNVALVSANADDSNFIITEIMHNPIKNCDGEKSKWIELRALSDISIKIESDKVEDENYKYIIKGFFTCDKWNKDNNKCANGYSHYLYSKKKIFRIQKGDYLIIASNPKSLENTYKNTDLPLILKSSIKLPTDRDSKEMFIAISGDGKKTWKNKITFSDFFNKKTTGYSLEKVTFSENDDKSNWQESYIYGGTPGKKSSTKKIFPTGILINELLPNPEGKDKEGEFIELYNANDFKVELKNWSLTNRKNNSFTFPDDSFSCGEKIKWEIKPKSYLLLNYSTYGFTLHNSGGEKIILKNPNGVPVSEASYAGNAKSGLAYAFDFNNEEFQWTTTPTPEKENIITAPKKKSRKKKSKGDSGENDLSSAEKVYLNEILPNPKGDEKTGEYIEIVNLENKPVDLYKWKLKDASKYGKYIFKEHFILGPGDYFAIHRRRFKFALNNSKGETVYLYNPRGKLTSSVTYDKAIENVSYNFNGSLWRWSKFLTPGGKNKFDEPPKVKISIPKRAYKNTYTKFRVRAKDKETKKLRYVWDFGDGRKSYLKKTSHKYTKTGRYTIKLTVRDESQSVEKVFRLQVKKHPRPDLEIVSLTPNPKGKDTELETMKIKNNSSKRVNLKGYKIATGSKKLYNHPIRENLYIKPGKTKTIDRQDSKFTLNNKKCEIQLLYPDQKIADKVKYEKDKIVDDEVYKKIDGQWQWISPPEKNNQENKKDENKQNTESQSQEGKIKGAAIDSENMFLSARVYTLKRADIFLQKLKKLDKYHGKMSLVRQIQNPYLDSLFLPP